MAVSHPLSDWQLHCVRRTVVRGGMIAYPTEAVWGLGCDPWDQQAVERILELKRRPVEKGVILVACSVDQIRFLLDPLPRSLQAEAERHWPGPVTCLLPDVEQQVPGASRRGISGRSGGISVTSSTGLCPARLAAIANPAGLLILSAASSFVRRVHVTAIR